MLKKMKKVTKSTQYGLKSIKKRLK